jgi:hypothetical protein
VAAQGIDPNEVAQNVDGARRGFSVRRLGDDLPAPFRYAAYAAALCGVLGGLAGLVVGLAAHPQTAWFAVLEVGVPAGLVGYVLGLLAGSAIHLLGRGR